MTRKGGKAAKSDRCRLGSGRETERGETMMIAFNEGGLEGEDGGPFGGWDG